MRKTERVRAAFVGKRPTCIADCAEVARTFNIRPATVWNIMRRAGATLPKPKRTIPQDRKEYLRRYYQEKVATDPEKMAERAKSARAWNARKREEKNAQRGRKAGARGASRRPAAGA